tara:strand:+ start:807 stop:1385 length:579 start_codon:yes stop_codon:yes gene_type:complete
MKQMVFFNPRPKTQSKQLPMLLNQRSYIRKLPPPPPPPAESLKKVKWGEPTWFLFHTLSEKVNDSDFAQLRDELLNVFYAICTNLPCPDCANHAKQYLDNVNFKAIQKKSQLKDLFYHFHNEVNARKGYDKYPYEGLEKYKTANTSNIIKNFMIHFSDKYRSIKLLASDLHRSKLVEHLKSWFNRNIKKFEQ